jgi:DNA repair protein RadC
MRIYEAKLTYHLVQEGPAEPVSNSSRVLNYMSGAFDELPLAESFYVIVLNRKNRPLGRHLVTIGTATAALAILARSSGSRL